jgi:hypothetical protein
LYPSYLTLNSSATSKLPILPGKSGVDFFPDPPSPAWQVAKNFSHEPKKQKRLNALNFEA